MDTETPTGEAIDPPLDPLAAAIDLRRKEADLTRHGLSVAASMSWGTLRRRMANTQDLRIGELYRVATALGTDPDVLLADARRRAESMKAAA